MINTVFIGGATEKDKDFDEFYIPNDTLRSKIRLVVEKLLKFNIFFKSFLHYITL